MMGITGKGAFLVCAASLALCGCDKIMGGGSAVVVTPSGAPAQGLAAVPSQAPSPSGIQTIDFGDDASKYSRDGECDDMRFGGAGMTDTPLLNSDIRHDATDCRSAFNQGRLTYKGENVSAPSTSTGYAESGVNHIIWGDDASKYAKDGECDDKRFAGAGMTDTPLLDSDVKHDATDCRAAYEQGRLQLRQ
jgi:hypothetical protein